MEFENYNKTSQTYDDLRLPIGLDSLDAALKRASDTLETPINELKLLDVGCGTGNYINAVKEKVGSCTGLEYNEGMSAKFKAKHEGDDRVQLHLGSVLDMDNYFPENSFDVVIMSQIMHHLTPDAHQKAVN